MQYFTYIWLDKNRKMYYIGMHEGYIDDNYISSSRWFNGEYNFRPSDFTKKILKLFNTRTEALQEEARLLSMINEHEFGKKYYNIKTGRKKGTPASNKGKPMSEEQRKKLSLAKLGKPSVRKGIPNKHKADCLENKEQSANPRSITV